MEFCERAEILLFAGEDVALNLNRATFCCCLKFRPLGNSADWKLALKFWKDSSPMRPDLHLDRFKMFYDCLEMSIII